MKSHTLPTRSLPTLAALAALAGVVFLASPRPATAQEDVRTLDELPRDAARAVLGFMNDSSTIRVSGRSRIPAARVIVGDVGVLGGPFTVAGRIEGELAVVNGSLVLEPGAEVTGDVTVVGGRIRGLPEARVDGRVTTYAQSVRYVRRDGRLVYAGTRYRPARRGDDPLRQDLGFGHSRITIRAGASYNRVEGLPVIFGPIVEFQGRNRLRIEALGIWRTESGLDLRPEELGYDVRIEQLLAGPALRLGAGVRSMVSPMEAWGASDVESSLSTFLFHDDLRDYLEKEGWSAYVRFRPRGTPLSLAATYRDERHRIVRAGSPWTLVDNDDPWRPQPLVAEGELRSVTAEATVDTRNRKDDPSHGWLLEGTVQLGVGGSLVEPEWTLEGPEDVADGFPDGSGRAARESELYFSRGLVDVRRYNRVGPGTRLHLRTVLGGSISGDPLPPQFQHAFGGVGSLPGYPLFAGDCGARSFTVSLPANGGAGPFHPFYGCDRFALFQAELRGTLGLDFRIGGDGDDGGEWDSYPTVDVTPSWAVFFDAARGWARNREVAPGPNGLPGEVGVPVDTGDFYDVGVGLFLGDLGLYWAYPLEGGDGVNFFVRLQRRF